MFCSVLLLSVIAIISILLLQLYPYETLKCKENDSRLYKAICSWGRCSTHLYGGFYLHYCCLSPLIASICNTRMHYWTSIRLTTPSVPKNCKIMVDQRSLLWWDIFLLEIKCILFFLLLASSGGGSFMEYYLTDCLDQVVTSWACLLIFGALKFLQWSSLLSSRRGMAFTVSGLAVVTVLMHILIRFSQSERSTPAKVAPAKTKNEGNPSETGDDKQHWVECLSILTYIGNPLAVSFVIIRVVWVSPLPFHLVSFHLKLVIVMSFITAQFVCISIHYLLVK